MTGAICVGYTFSGDFARNHWWFCFLIPAFIDCIKIILQVTIFKVKSPRGLYDEHKNILDTEDMIRMLSLNYQYLYDEDQSEKLA